jgi:hypothetical protein
MAERVAWRVPLAVLLALALTGPVAAGQGAPRVAVLELEWIDTSVPGGMPSEAEQRRLADSAERVRHTLDESQDYTLVDTAPAAALIAELGTRQQLHRCTGCDVQIGQALDADLVVVLWVQKVSNLILNMNALVRDVHSGATVRTASVDMRGNADETWRRAAEKLGQRLATSGGQEADHLGDR